MKIGEAELDRIYAFDLQLSEAVEELGVRAEALPDAPTEPALRSLLEATEAADRSFDERATVFEMVTQKGGA